MVRVRGLEPPRISPHEPKPCAYTNFATPARGGWRGRARTCDRTVNSRQLYQLSYAPIIYSCHTTYQSGSDSWGTTFLGYLTYGHC